MDVELVWFFKLPKKLNGEVIVVDVYAATTNLPLILSKSPKKLIIVNEKNLDQALKIYPGAILIGESKILPTARFMASNHPSDIDKLDFKGKTVLWMSINGSRVFEKAVGISQSGEVLSGAFCNAKALVNYIQTKKIKDVSIIMAGNNFHQAVEDKNGGEVLKKRLLNKPVNWEDVQKQVKKAIAKADVTYITGMIDQFEIVPKCIKNAEGFLEIVGTF